MHRAASRQAASPSPEHVRYGHPQWVDSLAKGAGFVCWALVLGAAAAVLREVFPQYVAAYHARRLGSVADGMCLLYGVWLLTAADPNGSTPPSDGALRWQLRGMLTVGLAGPVLQWASAQGLGGPSAAPMLVAGGLAAAAVGVAGRLVLLVHLRRMALRVPDAALARRLATLLAPYALALVTAGGVDALRTLPVLRHLGLPAAISLAVVTAVLLRQVSRLGRGLVIQTDFARGIWARNRAPMPGLSPQAA